VTARDGAVQTSGLTAVELPVTSARLVIEGPEGGIGGMASPAKPVLIKGQLEAPLAGHGSLMFWFRADQTYRSGSGQTTTSQKLIELPGVVTVSFETEKEMITILVQWAGADDAVKGRPIRIQLPEFPGAEWHHFALRWNGANGENDAFLDGTEYFLAGGKRNPWPVPEAQSLEIHVGRIAMADVRVSAKSLSPGDLAGVTGKRQGALDMLLGAKALVPFSAKAQRGKLLYQNALAVKGDITDWKLEGPGILDFADGWMQMRSERPDAKDGHFVLWCPREFPGNFQAEWDVEILGENGLCIVFFAARGKDNRDIFDPALAPRNGIFKQYTQGEMDCYHISYYANSPDSPRPVANLRKNHGFYLVANGPVGIQPTEQGKGRTHHAVLLKEGSRIRMAVDGRTISDFTDDGLRAGPVLNDGKIGLRQMSWTVARYRDFRVYAVDKPAAD